VIIRRIVRLRWWGKTAVVAGVITAPLTVWALVAFVLVPLNQKLHWIMATPAERLILEADALSRKGNWLRAAPLYKQAQKMFHDQGNASMEIYAQASQIPAQLETAPQPLSFWLAEINRELSLPAAQNPKTQLHLLQIKGQIENNYDAMLAYKTWQRVERLATQQHDWTLQNRAYGEEAIGLFLLGDLSTAKTHAFGSYARALYLRDSEGRARIASLIGAGEVEFKAYNDALSHLNKAISISKSTPDAAYPSVAVTAKIEALRGLKRYPEALSLCAEAMDVPARRHFKGHFYQVLSTRARVRDDMGDLTGATQDYAQAFEYARQLGYWRGLTEAGGPLATDYERQSQLEKALQIINEALNAQQHIPSEMYFSPRNLAIKADILRKLGRVAESNNLYERSLALVDSLLITAPTPNLVRRIVDDYATVYSGYFDSLCQQHNLPAAFMVIERAYGVVEQHALENRKHVPPHPPTPLEKELTALNLKLVSTDNEERREQLLSTISGVEDQLDSDPWSHSVASRPVALQTLQSDLHPGELLIEYVLADPKSYALAITRESVKPYTLPSREEIQLQTRRYISQLQHQGTDLGVAHKLFQQLLGPIAEFESHPSLIIVPSGDLYLLPFSALHDGKQYVVATHATSIVSAGTVLHMLRRRAAAEAEYRRPFIGFAPWAVESQPKTSPVLSVLSAWRGASGPKKSDFIPLPESKHEVLTGRDEIDKLERTAPSDDQVKIGPDATEAEFKQLPLADYQVLHLAVHGYADIEHPDRSALVFKHSPHETDDGLLQIREIRALHLNSGLVVLSACKTALGPTAEGGVANIANAFLQAGARTVVSSFWPTSDHASRQFMDLFYANLAQKETKAEALRHAAVASMSAGLPPYYWAAFEISGDPDEPLMTKDWNASHTRK